MSQLNLYPNASTIDAVNDELVIWTNSLSAVQNINRNTFLNLASQPVGLTDSQTLTNKTFTSPTINGATLSGTLSGTYTIGGTPTFPASVTQNTVVQTLTNKTLTSPTINSPTITNATISADTLTGYTTSNSGTIYGIPVTTGQISGSNTVLPAALATGIPTNKFSNPYKFSAYANATTALGSSGLPIKVSLNTKNFDTGSNFDNVTNYRFVAPVNGFYFITGQALVAYSGLSTAKNSVAYLYKNGLELRRSLTLMGSGDGNILPSLIVQGLFQFTAGDYVELWASTSDTAGGRLVGSGNNNTYLDGFLVSAT